MDVSRTAFAPERGAMREDSRRTVTAAKGPDRERSGPFVISDSTPTSSARGDEGQRVASSLSTYARPLHSDHKQDLEQALEATKLRVTDPAAAVAEGQLEISDVRRARTQGPKLRHTGLIHSAGATGPS